MRSSDFRNTKWQKIEGIKRANIFEIKDAPPRFPELGDPKRRNLYGIGCGMAGAACPRVNQYEYLPSIGARVLRAAQKVGDAGLTASTKRREIKTYLRKSYNYNCRRAFTKSTRSVQRVFGNLPKICRRCPRFRVEAASPRTWQCTLVKGLTCPFVRFCTLS